MKNNINREFIKSCDDVIAELSYKDMLASQPKNRKPNSKIKPYSLSQNTLYILEIKKDYINGIITEEEAKAILLRQKLCGNVI